MKYRLQRPLNKGGRVLEISTMKPHRIKALEQLRQAIIHCGFTMQSIAARSGTRSDVIRRWYRNEYMPSFFMLTNLAETLGYEITISPIKGFKYDDGTEPRPVQTDDEP